MRMGGGGGGGALFWDLAESLTLATSQSLLVVEVKTESPSAWISSQIAAGKVPTHIRDAFLRIAFPPRAVMSSESHWR